MVGNFDAETPRNLGTGDDFSYTPFQHNSVTVQFSPWRQCRGDVWRRLHESGGQKAAQPLPGSIISNLSHNASQSSISTQFAEFAALLPTMWILRRHFRTSRLLSTNGETSTSQKASPASRERSLRCVRACHKSSTMTVASWTCWLGILRKEILGVWSHF